MNQTKNAVNSPAPMAAVYLNALAEAERHYKKRSHVERRFVDEKDFGTEEEDEPVRGERNDEESERGSDQKKDIERR